MKRILVLVTLVALMMVMTAAPAFAFIHVTVPAGECAESLEAGNNEAAGAAIVAKNPQFDIPVGNAQGGVQSDPNC
jgi:hypothetical protein